MRAHALLSASGAERWINCPPSARLEEQRPDTTSIYAMEGTLAHEISEIKAREKVLQEIGPRKATTELNKLRKHELYHREMEGYTDKYIDILLDIVHSFSSAPFVAVEVRLDLSKYAPKSFGTSDCVVIGNNELYVVDFKYGKGVSVDATENTQMKLYALGAYERYKMLYDIKICNVVVVQPRINNDSKFTISIDELLDWGDNTVRPKAKLAFEGEGECSAGDWCRWCKVKGQCKERADYHMELEAFIKTDPKLLSADEISDLLERTKSIESWSKDLNKFALDAVVAGESIPGWKAVEGRSNRVIPDFKSLEKALVEYGIKKSKLYERKPLGITALEKLVGKKDFEIVASQYIEKPKGAPTLVPEGDKRQNYSTCPSINEAFADIKN